MLDHRGWAAVVVKIQSYGKVCHGSSIARYHSKFDLSAVNGRHPQARQRFKSKEIVSMECHTFTVMASITELSLKNITFSKVLSHIVLAKTFGANLLTKNSFADFSSKGFFQPNVFGQKNGSKKKKRFRKHSIGAFPKPDYLTK